MDQSEFTRRLLQLVNAQPKRVELTSDPYMRILGSLGFAKAIRQLQALLLCAALALGAAGVLKAMGAASSASSWGMAISLAAAGVMIVRRVPYWTPAGALRDGLVTLSNYRLNDLDAFLKHQRTDLTSLNNTLLSDLCMQLALDRRRPVTTHRSPVAGAKRGSNCGL
ncbi:MULTISPECIES: hypothetical protein [Pseudomonas]|uniref:hypothetical protein n=1 Tax=Pseudomonas TaxID=286 RepID=UPI00070D7995|nr:MULTISPECIES: hypothetical protein [Pseudomonas]KQW19718.1 hypothetical protein ASC85_07645 [Pseudomonas sp. Root401]WHS57627.1 hypothetical protein QLH64_30200 [Pseudomonas brassicacearum]